MEIQRLGCLRTSMMINYIAYKRNLSVNALAVEAGVKDLSELNYKTDTRAFHTILEMTQGKVDLDALFSKAHENKLFDSVNEEKHPDDFQERILVAIVTSGNSLVDLAGNAKWKEFIRKWCTLRYIPKTEMTYKEAKMLQRTTQVSWNWLFFNQGPMFNTDEYRQVYIKRPRIFGAKHVDKVRSNDDLVDMEAYTCTCNSCGDAEFELDKSYSDVKFPVPREYLSNHEKQCKLIKISTLFKGIKWYVVDLLKKYPEEDKYYLFKRKGGEPVVDKYYAQPAESILGEVVMQPNCI